MSFIGNANEVITYLVFQPIAGFVSQEVLYLESLLHVAILHTEELN